MPVLLAIAVAATVVFWMYRARAAGQVATDLVGAAADVMNAPRRFGFRRRADQHPVEGIDRPDLAIGPLAVAFLELDRLPSAEQHQAVVAALGRHLTLPIAKAEEIMILGHWLVVQCNGAQPAIERLAKRLFRLDGQASLQPLTSVLRDIATAGGGTLSERKKSALEDIARHLRVR